MEGLKARVKSRKARWELAALILAGTDAQLQQQSAALAQSVADKPQTFKRSLSHCAATAAAGKTGKRAQRPIQRCCHLLLQ